MTLMLMLRGLTDEYASLFPAKIYMRTSGFRLFCLLSIFMLPDSQQGNSPTSSSMLGLSYRQQEPGYLKDC